MPSAKRFIPNNSSFTSKDSVESLCSSGKPVKLAFVTPYPPRHDGLSEYASNLRTALLEQCKNLQVNPALLEQLLPYAELLIFFLQLQIDVFAVVLDFWNAEHEDYDKNIGEGLCYVSTWY
jgi:hypothetical protein